MSSGSLADLKAKKRKLEGLKTTCQDMADMLGKCSTALEKCNEVITEESPGGFSLHTFETLLPIESFLNGVQNFIDSESIFTEAYSSGTYSFDFFRNLETQSSEIVAARELCIEELNRLKEAVANRISIVDTLTSSVDTISSKLDTEIETLENKITVLEKQSA